MMIIIIKPLIKEQGWRRLTRIANNKLEKKKTVYLKKLFKMQKPLCSFSNLNNYLFLLGVFSLRDMYEQFQNIMKMGPFGQIMVGAQPTLASFLQIDFLCNGPLNAD